MKRGRVSVSVAILFLVSAFLVAAHEDDKVLLAPPPMAVVLVDSSESMEYEECDALEGEDCHPPLVAPPPDLNPPGDDPALFHADRDVVGHPSLPERPDGAVEDLPQSDEDGRVYDHYGRMDVQRSVPERVYDSETEEHPEKEYEKRVVGIPPQDFAGQATQVLNVNATESKVDMNDSEKPKKGFFAKFFSFGKDLPREDVGGTIEEDASKKETFWSRFKGVFGFG